MNSKKLFYYSVIIIIIALQTFIYIAADLDLETNLDDINLNFFDYARITDVDYKAVVIDEPGSNGKIAVTEKLTFDIHAASKNNLYWELWRALSESTVDGVKVEYKVKSVKQIFDNGEEIIYSESPKLYWDDEDYVNTNTLYGPGKWYHSKGPYDPENRQYECVLFYVDGLYREKPTFEIEYEMYNAALRYNDCSELYLSMYSESSTKYLNSFKGEILIPESKMPKAENYEAHTYGTNAHSFPYTESRTLNPGYHTFSFNLDKKHLKFQPSTQYIEFDLISFGEDKDSFTKYASINNYYYDDVLDELRDEYKKYESDAKFADNMKGTIFLICIVITFLIIRNSCNKERKMETKYNFYKPSMQMQYYRDIPSNLDPKFAAELAFCKNGKPKNDLNCYSAILLSLVRKEYIELTRINNSSNWNFNNVKIIIKNIPTSIEPNNQIDNETKKYEKLTLTEEYYFNLILKYSNNNELQLKTFQNKISIDIQNTNTFVTNIDNSISNIGITQGYFQNANYKRPKEELNILANNYIIFSLIFLTIRKYYNVSNTRRISFWFIIYIRNRIINKCNTP